MTRHLRLLHVHCRYREAGGEDVVVDAERTALRQAGVDVIAHDAANPETPLASAGRLLLAPWNPAAHLEVQRVVRRHRVDIAHVHNTWFTLSPSIVEGLHRAGVPLVATVHNFRLTCVNGLLYRDGHVCTDCVGRGPWRGVAHRCYRASALASTAVAATTQLNRAAGTWNRGVDRFLVLSELAAKVLTASGVPEAAVSRTANFVPDPGPRARPPSASRTIVYVGRLAHEKGVDLLLRAWRDWQPNEDWKLVVAGNGPLRPDLDLLTDHRVRFVGRLTRDEVTALLLRARALVVPSRVFENQPMAAVEAFAAGLPVLGHAIGGTLEVLRPLGVRWQVPQATAAAWVRALDVVRHDDVVDAAGVTSRRHYDHTFTEEVAVARLLAIYDDLRRRSPIGAA